MNNFKFKALLAVLLIIVTMFSGMLEYTAVVQAAEKAAVTDDVGNIYVSTENSEESEKERKTCPINQMLFPDEVFRKYIRECVDLDKDSALSQEEIARVVFMDVSGKGITSLQGIEVFTELEELKCSGNNLVELDVTALTKLENLVCENNSVAVAADADNGFTLSFTMPDYASRIKNLTGAYKRGNTFIAVTESVSYSFDVGNGFDITVFLQINKFHKDVEQVAYEADYSEEVVEPKETSAFQEQEVSKADDIIPGQDYVNTGIANTAVDDINSFMGNKAVTFSDQSESAYECVDDIWITGSVKAASKTNSKVTLYALDGWAQKYISIPTKYQQSFTIKIAGYNSSKIKWYSENEGIAYVNSKGVIFPKETGQCYEFDDPVKIYGYIDDKKIEITVTVKDYSEIYADEIMNQYITQHITASMNTYDKVKQICEFVASYNYDASYSSAEGMIISGGGDCWASTDTVNRMCSKLNIRAGTREKAYIDPGAGIGHMNSYVVIDGKTYIVDVGYDGKAPRQYSVSEIEKPYIYSEKEDGTLKITLYDGYSEKVEIPAQIDGKTVSELGEGAFSCHSEIKKVIMPDSIKVIGKEVFWLCSDLKSVTFSKNLRVIPQHAFYGTNIAKIKIPDNIEEVHDRSIGRYIYYSGPDGHYGYIAEPEIIEVPKSVKKIELNLSDTVILYHGTKKEWKKIKLSSSPDKIFYSNEGIALSKKSISIKQGKRKTLKAYCVDKMLCTSNDNSVVTVSSGKIKAVGAGMATVTVSNPDKKSVSCTIRVKPEKQTLKSLKLKQGKKIKVKWKKNKTATGYQIQYSTDEKFKKSVKTISVKNKRTTSRSISKLEEGKIYYVRVRSYKNIKVNGKIKKLYGEWSSKKSSGVILNG